MKTSRSFRVLTAAVLAALLSAPAHGFTFKHAPEYSYSDGKKVAELQLLAKGEELEGIIDKAQYELDPSLAKGVKSSTAYWTGILGPKAKNTTPWQIFITTRKNNGNASATTMSFSIKKGDLALTKDNYVALQLQKGKKLIQMTEAVGNADKAPDGSFGLSMITIGQYLGAARKGAVDGWWTDTDTVLPTNEQAADFVGTFRHELGHALGIIWHSEYLDKNGKPFNPQTEAEAENASGSAFSRQVTDPNAWNYHLYDQNLNQGKPGMPVLTTSQFNARKKKNPGLKKSDFFIVDDEGSNTSRKGHAFFIGKHVTEALDGATFYGVSGLPVNTWEGSSFEGSHLETTGMMSHRFYGNYTGFMEAELAVMQDLGYDFDRKAYFGYSVYGNGQTITNEHGYFARNSDGTGYKKGTPSKVPLGIGLHIYGSRNTVTQAADILTEGTGATGVRIDGMQNTLIVPQKTRIKADGLRGNGILVSYGRDQVINQEGTVTAAGKGGTAVRFDFGSSSNGASDEYRGSYIRYRRKVNEKTGEFTTSSNPRLTNMDSDSYNVAADELNGPLVREYNLSGKLKGGQYAVYISRNALVKNINVNRGAQISGDIVSDWKHFKTDGSYDAKAGSKFREPLYIQYNGNAYEYDSYVPDLVTNLNFNTDLTYQGSVTGNDNLKLNVKKGTLRYGGKADVVGVNVEKGATLLGGSYTVHDMTLMTTTDNASRLTDLDRGNLISLGTIGAGSEASSMKITGALISTGTLQGMAGGSKGTIEVSGSAAVKGSNVIARQLLPDEKFTVLKAASVYGPVKNGEETPYKFGMLNEIGEVEGSTAVVTGKAANNLGEMDSTQAETYDAMMEMYDSLTESGDSRRNEMRSLFTLTPSETKKVLSSLASNTAAKSMALAQRSTMTKQILSSRLNDAFKPAETSAEIPLLHLTDSNDGGIPVTLKTLEPADNDLWVKYGKNWGDMREGSDYHSTTAMIGWDKQIAPSWRAGVFAGYGRTGFSDAENGNELRDTRVGLYTGFHTAKTEGMAYLDYGWMNNRLHRRLSGMYLGSGERSARYHSRILELGGEYLFDLNAGKNTPWHVRPYVNAQLSRLWQNGYSEQGAGIFGQDVDGKKNDYIAAGTGIEWKRYLAGGSYAIRAGVKHAFTGAEPKLRYGYLGDAANHYDMKNVQDKTHFLLSVGGEVEIAKGLTIGGDAAFERGSHDKDWSCSVTVKRTW